MYPSLLTRLRSVVSGESYPLKTTSDNNLASLTEKEIPISTIQLSTSNVKQDEIVSNMKQYNINSSKNLGLSDCNEFGLKTKVGNQFDDSIELHVHTNINGISKGNSTLIDKGYTVPIQDIFVQPEYRELTGFSEMAVELFIMEPRGLDDVSDAIHILQNEKAIMLNLSLMGLENAQRAVDLIAGGTFAIQGWQEQISEKIFLFAPGSIKCTLNSKRIQPSFHNLINQGKVSFYNKSTASTWLKYEFNAVHLGLDNNIN